MDLSVIYKDDGIYKRIDFEVFLIKLLDKDSLFYKKLKKYNNSAERFRDIYIDIYQYNDSDENFRHQHWVQEIKTFKDEVSPFLMCYEDDSYRILYILNDSKIDRDIEHYRYI